MRARGAARGRRARGGRDAAGRGGRRAVRGDRWLLALALAACEPAATPTPAAPAAPASAPVEQAPAVARPLLAWLDPDAAAAVYTRLGGDLDLEAVASLFAVPPRAAHMLRDLRAFDDGLAALTLGVAPPPREWLSTEALALLSPMGRGPYLVRGLTRPRAEVEGWLQAAGLAREVVEGMTVYAPRPPGSEGEGDAPGQHLAAATAFPWKLVFLEDQVVGGFSLHEIGTGLGPLTAARDLPASDLEAQWTRAFADDPALQLELFASGPMLSLDLPDDIGVIRLGLRRWQRAGVDAEVVLQPLGDAAAAAKALEARVPAHESDVVRELYDRAAFTAESAEPPLVRGRLQLTEQDLTPLRRRGDAG